MQKPSIVLLLAAVISVQCGSVGRCRTECVEKNVAKIVRVHLKDDLVMIGLCSNNTDSNSVSQERSVVTPYVCHRNIGLWTYDELDKEGIAKFETLCPTPEQFPLSVQLLCPRVSESHDGTPLAFENDDFTSSGDSPLRAI